MAQYRLCCPIQRADSARRQLGGMILPTLVGRVIETTGAASMTRLVAASLSLNLIAFAFLPRAHRRSVAAGSDGTAAAL